MFCRIFPQPPGRRSTRASVCGRMRMRSEGREPPWSVSPGSGSAGSCPGGGATDTRGPLERCMCWGAPWATPAHRSTPPRRRSAPARGWCTPGCRGRCTPSWRPGAPPLWPAPFRGPTRSFWRRWPAATCGWWARGWAGPPGREDGLLPPGGPGGGPWCWTPTA